MARVDKTAKLLGTYFDCDYEYFKEDSPYEDVLARFSECEQEGLTQGYTPVIVTIDDSLYEQFILNADCEDKLDLDKIRAYRQDLLNTKLEDGKEVLNSLLNTYKQDAKEDGFDFEKDFVGSISHGTSFNDAISFLNDNNNTVALCIVKVPVKNPWEVFAYLPMGDFNDCPSNERLMAISKYFYEKYDAKIMAITHSALEYSVEKFIKDKDVALNEAKLMYGFCPDILQNFDTIGEFAGTLINSSMWYFWWD